MNVPYHEKSQTFTCIQNERLKTWTSKESDSAKIYSLVNAT